jgi:NADPH:quinone reductase-like Zn-dependent oxidoreductase
MKAAFYSINGGPEVLQFGEVAAPELSPDTVLIRVHSVAIQGGDVRARRDVPPPSPQHIVGYQASGLVAAVGDAVTKFAPGDPVVGFARAGSHAELFAVREHHAYPVPRGMDLALAATIPIEFGTASEALFEVGHLAAGQTVLVRGAAGGVGLGAVQLASDVGATVIAIAAGAARLEKLRAFGARHGIDYTSEDIVGRTLELTGNQGVDLVLDLAGGKLLTPACAHRARYGIVGAASGVIPTFSAMDLMPKSVTVFGLLFGADMHLPRIQARIVELLEKAHRGEIKMPIERTFPLSQAAAAHAFIETAHPFGRVLLTTQSS